MPTESLCIQVPKIHAQKTIAATNKLEIGNRELEIENNARFVYIPITRQPSERELAILKEDAPDSQLEVRTFPERKRREKTLIEVLENQLPPHLLAGLPRALDTIGDIAIIEIPPELNAYANLVGEAILKTHKNARTVIAKAGAVSGPYRLREFNTIAGEPKTATLHKEHGCKYYVDIAEAYFSPRLSHEHKRVASLVQKGETVIDMFAGVGPFAILIAKNNENSKVYAIDINPEAIEFLKRNIRLNRVENRVFAILGDAKQVVEDKFLGVADRVVMNLPEKAIEFVNVACRAVKQEGGIVHFYSFVRLPDSLEDMKRRFSEAVEKADKKVEKFLSAKTVRETAPYEWQIIIDAKIL